MKIRISSVLEHSIYSKRTYIPIFLLLKERVKHGQSGDLVRRTNA